MNWDEFATLVAAELFAAIVIAVWRSLREWLTHHSWALAVLSSIATSAITAGLVMTLNSSSASSPPPVDIAQVLSGLKTISSEPGGADPVDPAYDGNVATNYSAACPMKTVIVGGECSVTAGAAFLNNSGVTSSNRFHCTWTGLGKGFSPMVYARCLTAK